MQLLMTDSLHTVTPYQLISPIMTYTKDFSVIIPHRNSLHFLPKLFSSIPKSEQIEIILVDNSPTPITKEDVGIERDYQLIYSAPERGAGGARNEGIEHANGKWLLFADADDYYTEDAFDVYYSMFNTDAEMVYTEMGGIYADTGEPSNRGEKYVKLVNDYLRGMITEMYLRLEFSSPCCKMVSHDLVQRHHLRYDEVLASNDMYFSMLTGYYAKGIKAIGKITYIATVSKGSLTRRRDKPVIISRFLVYLRYNKFVKEHNLAEYQKSVMNMFYQSCKLGLRSSIHCIALMIQYGQNPFIGCKRWMGSYKRGRLTEKKEIKYITH